MTKLWALRDFNKIKAYRPSPIGIICPQCGVRLKVQEWPFTLFTLAVMGGYFIVLQTFFPDVHLHRILLFRDSSPRDSTAEAVAIVLTVGILICYVKFGIYFCRVRPLNDSDLDIDYPLSHDTWKDDFTE